jgi:hypothetical protein
VCVNNYTFWKLRNELPQGVRGEGRKRIKMKWKGKEKKKRKGKGDKIVIVMKRMLIFCTCNVI